MDCLKHICIKIAEKPYQEEGDVQESREVHQRVPREGARRGPPAPSGQEERQLLRACRAQTGLRHQTQRVSVHYYGERGGGGGGAMSVSITFYFFQAYY